jgi:hypothetical protein
MNGRDNRDFADKINLLRRDLAELKEMVRLGARIPGDDQRIEQIKLLLEQWRVFAPVAMTDGNAAGRERATQCYEFATVARDAFYRNV